MTKFREGDKVLVEANITGRDDEIMLRRKDGDWWIVNVGKTYGERFSRDGLRLQAAPPVPVEDLLEELELLRHAMPDGHCVGHSNCVCSKCRRVRELRDAREAASKPRYKPGDEVWVRAKVTDTYSGGAVQAQVSPHGKPGRFAFTFSPDDLRPAEDE